MTDTLAVIPKPVWTNPGNLKDNTIVTANLWNTVTSDVGSVEWLQSRTADRAACNIAVAQWTQLIPVKSSASGSSTQIKFTSNSNGTYFKADGGIILPADTPCLIIWKVWFFGESVRTGYSQRTTLFKRYYTNNGKTINRQTVASYFNRKYNASQVVINASYAVVANFASDRYYITVDHGFHTAINTRGTCHVIINPGMV
jgi:hypothetical protein